MVRAIGSGGRREGFNGRAHSPREERDLRPLPAVVLLKVKVVHRPPALVLREVPDELVVRRGRRARLLDDDLRVVLVEREDDVLGLLAQLQVLVRRQALGVHANAGGLVRGAGECSDVR